MALTKNRGRQAALTAIQHFTFDDLTSGTLAEAVDLPAGAYIIDGEVVITTAFNSGTSDALVVGDSTAANALKTSYSIAATGRTALVPYGGTYAAKDAITLTWTAVGAAATAGAGFIRVTYAIDGRATEVQP